ncbi:MAG TPA: serine hydrolase [Fibrobacteria bacterium]|nr:serine hydrolase [Fibrobacteria bacterium]HOX50712.1 serine hydrolase [Fibrobacteria bacterium]
MQKVLHGFLLGLAILFPSSCAITKIGQSPAPTSDAEWDIASPGSVGFDEKILDKLTQDIKDNKFSNIHAVLVEYDGKLIYEQYFGGPDEIWGRPIGSRDFGRDSLHDLRSVSKSVTSLVLGIALAGNYDSALNRPLPSFFPKLRTSPDMQTVNLHHALTMTAGIEWNEMTEPYTGSTNDDNRLFSTRDPVALVLNRPLASKPGTDWYYNGGLTQVAAGVVQEVSGKPLDVVAKERLFAPLGITTFDWIGSPAWHPSMPAAAWGLRMRARDLAKIGSVCLHDGRWKGRQIVPKEWIERSTRRHVETIGAWSNGNMWGYGYQFWVGNLPQGHRIVAARGLGDQNIYIVPEEKLVVTTYAGAYNSGVKNSERILRRILSAKR